MRSSYPITQRIMRRVVRPIGLTAMDSVLDPADVHAAAFVEENELFAALAASADLATPVPTCPEWTLKQLFRHVGRGDRWAATIVRTGEPADPREVADGRPPEGGLVEWLRGGPRAVLDAVTEVGPDTPVWTFTGPQPASWWVRRREHEVLVHRADAAFALGVDYSLPADRAADGLSEYLGLLAARKPDPADPPLADGASVHLHAAEEIGPAGEWMIRGSGGGVVWEHGHGKGDVAVRGPAVDLLLAVVGRRRPDSVETIGDADLWERWIARSGF
jgi:uncharacterized protein (TIGR03083 family)